MRIRFVWIAFVLVCACGAVRGQSLGWDKCQMVVDSFGGLTLLDDAAPLRGETFLAEGKTLTTGPEGYASLVLSNGLTVYCGPNSRLTIVQAEQSEMVSMYAGAEYEEMRTHIVLDLSDGEFAFIQPEPDPTSSLELLTRYGRIEGDATQFSLLLGPQESLAAALKGSLYYYPRDGGARRFIAEGQVMDVRMASRGETTQSLSSIGVRGRMRYTAMLEQANKTALRMYFSIDGDRPHFVNLVRLDRLNRTAFNDYRLSP